MDKTGKRKPSPVLKRNYDYHRPVLLKQSVDLLVTNSDGIYIDGTCGGCGHAAEILGRLSSGGKLFAFDKDEEAINYCRKKFTEKHGGKEAAIELSVGCFSSACSIKEAKGRLHGILLDLGVSSRQLDESRRGFSYRVDSKLDMRFNPHGKTASDLLNNSTQEELRKIFRDYGEEPFTGAIARRLVQRRRAAPLENTFDLRSVVEESVPPRFCLKSLSRIFQAVRIAVNDELGVLLVALNSALESLIPGGRIVVISYHSLEDRIVKNFFKEHSSTTKSSPFNLATSMPKLRILTKKPIIPDEDEISTNPRSRSAKLRAAEKL